MHTLRFDATRPMWHAIHIKTCQAAARTPPKYANVNDLQAISVVSSWPIVTLIKRNWNENTKL